MKKVIVIYSKTGNTRLVAEKLNRVIEATLLEVKATSDEPYQTHPVLKEVPNVSQHDHLVLGTPVHAFRLPAIMSAYLKQVPDLKGKRVDLFVTHHFPFAWLGGNQSLRQMKRMVLSKGGNVTSTTSINWSSKHRDQDIETFIRQIGA